MSDSKSYEELKKDYEELEQSFRKTKDVVGVLNNKIEDLNDKLLQSESLKTTFVSNLKNELNDPLSTLFALSSSLIKENDLETEYVRDVVNIFYKELSNLYQKISNIFAAADIEAGNIEINSSRINIDSFVDDIVQMFENTLLEKNVHLDYKVIGGRNLTFITDSSKLHLILMNLLSNSIYYTRNDCEIRLKIWKTEDNLNIVLEDYGETFDDENVNKDFLNFLSVGVESSKSSRGENLSISIMKIMIEMLGGTLDITHTGNSSIIAVFLPEFDLETSESSSEGNDIFFDDDTEIF